MTTEKQLPDLLETVKSYAGLRKKPLTLLSKNIGKASNTVSVHCMLRCKTALRNL